IFEAKDLARKGVKELIVVAQDPTVYGSDIYGKPALCELLRELIKIDGIEWIRTLYTYPERITDELLCLLRDEKKLVKYLDIPIQHCEDNILKRMNRKSSKKELVSLIKKIRATVPDITLRTTLIVGFPGETDGDFTKLHEFVKEMRFDKLGCFTYSAEEETLAAEYPDQIDEQTKQDRAELIMQSQADISRELNEAKVGKTVRVLIEGYDDYIKCYFGRSEADAPEIDGKVFFITPRPLKIGDFADVKINDTLEYDLLGELADEYTE
ncbi:MAG: MiaB/RimO family radical SAM methylthiotransferase, partial [Clostridia bacterium]|nr:MiaB/RimO family radical SAM methylthiotransferase [Clostridia bacterium]